MTIGANAELPARPEGAPVNYLELEDATLHVIELARIQVADAESIDDIQSAVNSLNDVLHADGLLGKTARLKAPDTIVLAQSVRYHDATLQPAPRPVVSASTDQEGVLVGCDAVALNGTNHELVYRLELPLSENGLEFRTAIAPVDSARISVEVAQPILVDKDAQLNDAMVYLDSIQDPRVQVTVEDMMNLLDEREDVGADFFRELATLATEALELPIVAEDKRARDAIITVFASFIDVDAWYGFTGIDARVVEKGGHRFSDIREVEAVGQITAATTVRDFDYNPSKNQNEGLLNWNKGLQPAFLILDDDDVEHIIPIRHLTEFYVEEHSELSSKCDTARTNFLSQNPNLFSPGYQHESDTPMLKKYSQNGDGSV